MTITDQDALYAGYLARFQAYLAKRVVAFSSTADTHSRGYFYPQDSGSQLIDILDNIDCSATNTTGGWGDKHYTSIHVVQAQIDDVTIAKKLLALDTAGCVVHVVRRTNFSTDPRTTDVDKILLTCEKSNGITQDLLARSSTSQTYVHSKYLVIDGNYDGRANQRFVWTGSYNYTEGALRSNDETLLKLSNPDLIDGFQSNFRKLATLPTTDGLGQAYRETIQPGSATTCAAPGHL